MLFDEILGEPLEKLSVPLDDCFLFFSANFLDIIIFLLESLEYIVEFLLLTEDLDHSSQESTIYIFNQSFAICLMDLARVLQSQNS